VSSKTLAVIMDPIESIKPHKDSSLAMLLEAQNRGWKIHYGQLSDIWLRDGQALGRLTRLQVADDQANWFGLGVVAVTPLGGMDVILMRKDPPFDMNYIFATYVLQRAEEHGALVVNRP
jgi:glutathione synthase